MINFLYSVTLALSPAWNYINLKAIWYLIFVSRVLKLRSPLLILAHDQVSVPQTKYPAWCPVPGHCLTPPNHIFTKLHFSLSLSQTDRRCSMLSGDEDKFCINISRSRRGSEFYSLLDLFMWARGVLLQRNVPPMKLLYPEIYRDVSTRMIRNVRDWILHTRRPARNNQT